MVSACTATVAERLDDAAAALAAAGIDSARNDAEWLLADALGARRVDLYLALDRPLSPAVAARFDAAVARRRRREPLQRIVGWEAFCGLRLTVAPDVLVPRPETETLAEWAIAVLPERRVLVVDVGTGSGCLACAVAAARPSARVLAIDRAPAAVAAAQANADALGLGARVTVLAGDLLSPLGDARVDLIVSNPPYLPTAVLPGLAPEVADHDPRAAVDGGRDGLDVIRPLVAEAAQRLVEGGRLLLETAGGEQARRVAALMTEAGLREVTMRRDLAGIERFVGGIR